MNKPLYLLVTLFFSLLCFFFGWLTHPTYTPVQKVKNISTLEKIKKRKRLNVVLLNSPVCYYIGVDGAQGFEYDLLQAYAKHLHVDLNITVAHTVKEALTLSKKKNIDITSATLAKTPLREKKFNFGPSYFEVEEQLICNRDMMRDETFPKNLESLKNISIMVGEETSYSERVQDLKEDGYDINLTTTVDFSTEELLEKVADHQIDCTIAASHIYSLNQRYFPEIVMAFSISQREQLAWLLAEDSKDLKVDMYRWLNEFNQVGKMNQLRDHYFSYILLFDYYDIKMFYKRVESRLSKYKHIFKKAGKDFSIPWTLLASISYQESHWNPKAKSFTGVRGLMMLTRHTAKLLHVKNRLNPKESIIGGTRHIKQMLKFVPAEVEGENRLKFALAAYNLGLGHIHDAQALARERGLNPNEWSDLKVVLPLLSQKKYYKNLQYGFARGSEAVKYVESIYNYRDILEKLVKK